MRPARRGGRGGAVTRVSATEKEIAEGQKRNESREHVHDGLHPDPVRQKRPYHSKGRSMNTSIKSARMDTRILLLVLWLFYTVNFMYADSLSSLEPGVLQQEMSGYVADGTVKITAGFLLGTAAMFEIPFLMIVLSWVLKYRANRLANIVAATLFIVVQVGSLFLGKPSPMYLFYSTVEIVGLLLIIWNAWRWKPTVEPAAV
jgi:hypothetical protein